MKKILLSLIFVLTLQNSAHADEVKDFQIEGINIGDSLFEHINILGVSKNDILKRELFYYPKSKKFAGLAFSNRGFYKTYDLIQFTIIPKTYIIESISGVVDIISKKDCEKKQEVIFSEILKMFKNRKIKKDSFSAHPHDKTGNSSANGFYVEFKSGNVSVECYLWGKEIKDKTNWIDNLKVSVTSQKAQYFFNEEAYN
jgi:hypothetical protein